MNLKKILDSINEEFGGTVDFSEYEHYEDEDRSIVWTSQCERFSVNGDDETDSVFLNDHYTDCEICFPATKDGINLLTVTINFVIQAIESTK